ncbi:molybdenum cofactor biosynthesis protein MoaE [Candidatus Uabimicrobium amorphum]|uniref:Molybdopterin synthase catalytic subunit n=1 Tax=Uabimicrobium amorphum TaxID=2596890 RepID=A0A5S9IJQ6_UABAM|nr:molybdenum cofactor biosynthesis protein MoaE [Candidatus Uabimicrobium amorphum]BBM82791.1 molybdopterin-converting factor chain 2 [Candidatus Uabimicrobium amorphum]
MFYLEETNINTSALQSNLCNERAGGYVSFEGWVRNHNHGKEVTKLEYEAYTPLAVKEAAKILQEAQQKFSILEAHCVHRVGSLKIGEVAVWVGVNSVHRGPAFDACEYIIDELKVRVPIWKKEHYLDGDSGWVKCEHCHEKKV